MTLEQAAAISATLCTNANVNLCGCNTGDDPTKLRLLANKLKRRVCGCKGSAFPGCKCLGSWVCQDPQK